MCTCTENFQDNDNNNANDSDNVNDNNHSRLEESSTSRFVSEAAVAVVSIESCEKVDSNSWVALAFLHNEIT